MFCLPHAVVARVFWGCRQVAELVDAETEQVEHVLVVDNLAAAEDELEVQPARQQREQSDRGQLHDGDAPVRVEQRPGGEHHGDRAGQRDPERDARQHLGRPVRGGGGSTRNRHGNAPSAAYVRASGRFPHCR